MTHWLDILATSAAVEWFAAAIGAYSVYLSTRENIWSWPTAIVNVVLYIFIFARQGLYSDMGLQVVYLVLSIYGWYEWLHGGANRGRLEVSKASARVWVGSAIAGGIGWYAIWQVTHRLPGVSIPLVDSGLAAVSLVGQWMMTKKIIENWVLWIIADLVYVPMYIYKHLYPTAGLYLVFAILATKGWIDWKRSYRRITAAAAAPASPALS